MDTILETIGFRAAFFPNKPQQNQMLGPIVHVIPGTFNPIHEGHIAIYELLDGPNSKYFEFSITNRVKGVFSREICSKVIEQFFTRSLPLVVTNLPTFKSKVDYFVGVLNVFPIFHIGYDVAFKLLMDEGKKNIEDMEASFVVYDRSGNGIRHIPEEYKPANVLQGKHLPGATLNLSSTKLRNESNA